MSAQVMISQFARLSPTSPLTAQSLLGILSLSASPRLVNVFILSFSQNKFKNLKKKKTLTLPFYSSSSHHLGSDFRVCVDNPLNILAFQFLHFLSVGATSLCCTSAICSHCIPSILSPGSIYCPHFTITCYPFFSLIMATTPQVPWLYHSACLFFPNIDIHDPLFHCFGDNFNSFVPLPFTCTTYLNSSLE